MAECFAHLCLLAAAGLLTSCQTCARSATRLQEELFLRFAEFEEKVKEVERAR